MYRCVLHAQNTYLAIIPLYERDQEKYNQIQLCAPLISSLSAPQSAGRTKGAPMHTQLKIYLTSQNSLVYLGC